MDEFEFDFTFDCEDDICLDNETFMEIMNDDDKSIDDDCNTGDNIVDINQKWTMEDDFSVSIEYDPVDAICLEKVTDEAPKVMKNIMSRIPGRKKKTALMYTPNDFLKVWFPLELRLELLRWIRQYLQDIEPSEITEFLKVELLLHVYQCSPTRFYDPIMKNRYQQNNEYMKVSRFFEIVRALEGIATTTTRNSSISNLDKGTACWTPPFQVNKPMQQAFKKFRTHFAQIAFIPDATWVGLDDDLLRMRSRTVVESGYSQINNPCKGMGVVQHGAVSVMTNLFLSGHVQTKKDSTADCVTIIQKSLTASDLESHIDLGNTPFFFDRGYGGPDGSIHRASIERGAALLGTAKRSASFPFTHAAKKPCLNRVNISEDGAPCCYWAKKATARGKFHYALGFRNGLSRVVLLQTTMEECGPGKYAFIPKAKVAKSIEESDVHPCLKAFDDGVIQLTKEQKTPEWFILRRFRITGTGAEVIWKFSSKKENDNHILRVLLLLDLPQLPVANNDTVANNSTMNDDDNVVRTDNSSENTQVLINAINVGTNIVLNETVNVDVNNDEISLINDDELMVNDDTNIVEANLINDDAINVGNDVSNVARTDNETVNDDDDDDVSNVARTDNSSESTQVLINAINVGTNIVLNETVNDDDADDDSDELTVNDNANIGEANVINDNAILVCNDVSITVNPEIEHNRVVYNAATIKKIKVAELRTLSIANNLPWKKIKKKELVEQLLSLLQTTNRTELDSAPVGTANSTQNPSSCTELQEVLAALPLPIQLMKTWFLTPHRGTRETKLGSANESNIIDNLPTHFTKYVQTIKILVIQEYGLLCSKQCDFGAFSPDGIAVASSGDDTFCALLEFKTKCVENTVKDEKDLAKLVGAFFTVELKDGDGGKNFRYAIPELKHRAQLLHGMACGKIQDAFYVVASESKIIRIVHVKCDESDLDHYMKALADVYSSANMEWIHSNNVPLPSLTCEIYKEHLEYAVDDKTVKQALLLWRALNKYVMDNGAPHPGRLILPTVIAYWNRCKGPIDTYSQYLSHVQARHGKMNVIGRIWIRLIMTCVYNAYHSFALHKILEDLQQGTYATFTDFKSAKKDKAGSFIQFCSVLSDSISTTIEGEIYVSSSNEEVENVILKNQRMKYFTDPELKKLRFDITKRHSIATICSRDKSSKYPQKCCVWCCQRDHNPDSEKKNCLKRDGSCKRMGFKTTTYCYDCRVALCNTVRYDGKTCFELWHSATEINNPCCIANVPTKQTRTSKVDGSDGVDGSAGVDGSDDNIDVDDEDDTNSIGHMSDISDDVESTTTIIYSPTKATRSLETVPVDAIQFDITEKTL